jgi:hypothetical protein
VNHKDVVYPRLWIALWRTPAVRALLVVLLAAAVAVLTPSYGFVRSAIGVALFAAILVFGYKYWRDVGLIPPEPDLEDVSDYGLKYVCTVCGLELKVEKASKDKPPTHCGEKMELVRSGGKPPLKPVD